MSANCSCGRGAQCTCAGGKPLKHDDSLPSYEALFPTYKPSGVPASYPLPPPPTGAPFTVPPPSPVSALLQPPPETAPSFPGAGSSYDMPPPSYLGPLHSDPPPVGPPPDGVVTTDSLPSCNTAAVTTESNPTLTAGASDSQSCSCKTKLSLSVCLVVFIILVLLRLLKAIGTNDDGYGGGGGNDGGGGGDGGGCGDGGDSHGNRWDQASNPWSKDSPDKKDWWDKKSPEKSEDSWVSRSDSVLDKNLPDGEESKDRDRRVPEPPRYAISSGGTGADRCVIL